MDINKQGFFIFDLETSKLFDNKLSADHEEQAWIVEFACIKATKDLATTSKFTAIVQPPFVGAEISPEATALHGIDLATSIAAGITQDELYSVLKPVFDGEFRLIGHNLGFDFKFLHRFPKTQDERINLAKSHYTGICTMKSSVGFCKLPPTASMLAKGMREYKAPKLGELYKVLFNEDMKDAHHALDDVEATFKCLKELVKLKVIVL